MTTVQQREKRYNIPVPIIKYVANYEAASKPVPTSYIRYKKPLDEEFEKAVQYNMDLDDEVLANFRCFHDFCGSVFGNILKCIFQNGQNWLKTNQPQLTYDRFEQMIDLLEKTLHKKGHCTQASFVLSSLHFPHAHAYICFLSPGRCRGHISPKTGAFQFGGCQDNQASAIILVSEAKPTA